MYGQSSSSASSASSASSRLVNGTAAVADDSAGEGDFPLVTVRPYDPRKPYGVARLVAVLDSESVVVQFVLGKKKVCNVLTKHLARPLTMAPVVPVVPVVPVLLREEDVR